MKQVRRKMKPAGPIKGGKVTEDPPDEDVGHNSATKSFEEDPSIENYVRLRRANPTINIEVGGMDR